MALREITDPQLDLANDALDLEAALAELLELGALAQALRGEGGETLRRGVRRRRRLPRLIGGAGREPRGVLDVARQRPEAPLHVLVLREVRAVLLQQVAEAHLQARQPIVQLAELEAARQLLLGERVELAAQLGDVRPHVFRRRDAEIELADPLAVVGARLHELPLERRDAARERSAIVEQRAEPSFQVDDAAFERCRLALRGDVRSAEERLQTFDRLPLEVDEETLGPCLEIASGLAGAPADLAAQGLDLAQDGFEARLTLTEQRLPELRKPLQELSTTRLQALKARRRRVRPRLRMSRPPTSSTLTHDASSRDRRREQHSAAHRRCPRSWGDLRRDTSLLGRSAARRSAATPALLVLA